MSLATASTEPVPALTFTPRLRWWQDLLGPIYCGLIYLASGPPGCGKSAIGLQLCLDLADQGDECVIIATEQTENAIGVRARLLAHDLPEDRRIPALNRIHVDTSVQDLEHLPAWFLRNVVAETGKYRNVRFLVLDSIQGHGTSSNAQKKFSALYQFWKRAAGHGVAVYNVCHVDKSGTTAGPMTLQHNIDVHIHFKSKVMGMTPMFVPKHRMGPAVTQAVPLALDPVSTSLGVSPHAQVTTCVARGYLGPKGRSSEAQVAVGLPALGSKGRIVPMGMSAKEVQQLCTTISHVVPECQLEDLDYKISVRLPGDKKYRCLMSLPLAVAIIGAYLRRPVPGHLVFIGEVDLLGQVRRIEAQQANDMSYTLVTDLEVESGDTFVTHPAFSAQFRTDSLQFPTAPVTTLMEAVHLAWPDLPIASSVSQTS